MAMIHYSEVRLYYSNVSGQPVKKGREVIERIEVVSVAAFSGGRG